MTVSLRPASQLSGGRGSPPSIGWRLTTSKVTSWMWMGCASAVKLWSSQTSIAPSATFSVMGSSQPSGLPLPSGLSVPRSASAGANGSPFSQSRTTLPLWSVVTFTVADSCSLSETWRVLVAAASGASAGSWRRPGGVLGSAPVAAMMWKRMTCPVVAGSAGAKSTPGTPPPNGSSGAMFCRMISVPSGVSVKSTITSARSAGAMSRSGSSTGAGRKPPSLPICQNVSPVDIRRIRKRELQPVEEAEAVAPLLHLQRRPRGAVDDDRVAEELRVPDRRDVALAAAGGVGHERDPQLRGIEPLEERAVVGIKQRTVGRERAVLDRDRNLVVGRPGRIAERRRGTRQDSHDRVSGSAAKQVEAGWPGVDVRAGHAKRVVVVPERRGALVVVVLKDRAAGRPRLPECGLGLGPERFVQRSPPRVAGGDVARRGQVPGLRVAVVLLGAVPAVQVRHDRHRPRVGRLIAAMLVAAGGAPGRVGPVQGLVDGQQVRPEVAVPCRRA